MIIERKDFCRALILLCGLMLAVPVLAGQSEDDGSPAAAARHWQETVGRLLATPGAGPMTDTERRDALIERARRTGTVRLIVRLKEPEVQPDLPADQVRAQWAARQQAVLGRLGLVNGLDRAAGPIKAFGRMNGFALRGDATDVIDLMNDLEVLDVVEDVPHPPTLLESVPLSGGLGGAFSGYTGSGQIVAILDTGVDKTHSMLSGKVIAEACYSTTDTAGGSTSLCPGGTAQSTAIGSAVNCDTTQWGSACGHGTHVAGIAAGNGALYTGVAKDAQLIAIQVFSGFSATACGTTTPCTMAWTSDIIRGLERVAALKAVHPTIAAANLSLGGGSYSSACNGDATKPAIDNLRSLGVATVIASGNDGSTTGIGSPACVSSAISVGATCDATNFYCPAVDAVASYSSSASFLSLLAPGSAITSAVPGESYGTWHGTSMATPHVAGAWAVMKQAKPNASVDEVLAYLKAAGKPVTDARNGVTTPRIQLATAVDQMNAGQVLPPTAPVAAAASGVTSTGFTANWGSAWGATGYRLDVSTSSAFATSVSGYADRDVGAATSLAMSGLSPSTTYYYRVRAYNGAGVSDSSGIQWATTSALVLSPPTALVANGITKTGFQLNWAATPGAAGYRLDVSTKSNFSTLLSAYKNRDVGNVTSAAITGLTANTTYYVRLRAFNGGTVSANSATLTAKTSR